MTAAWHDRPPTERGNVKRSVVVVATLVLAGGAAGVAVYAIARGPAPSRRRTSPAPTARPHAGAPADACAGPPGRTLTGPQHRFDGAVGGREHVAAGGASWTGTGDWAVSIAGGRGGCWEGGTIVGTWKDGTPWATYHHTGGLSFTNADFTIEGVHVYDYGDSINARQGSANWTARGVHLEYSHDDCIQNDFLSSALVDGSFLDGCYVGLSARPSSTDASSDGRENTWTVQNTLIWLRPMPTVFKGPAPGTGGFFKWDDNARSPKLVLKNVVLRADQLPNHGTLATPAASGYPVTCTNVTVVWLGAGPFPVSDPCYRVTTDKSVWDKAVAAWEAEHANR